MKLKEWAEKTGVKYLTAYRWFKSGTLPVKAYQTNSGTIIVESSEFPEEPMSNNQSTDTMSLFLKKTVEFSKNNASVEDFAAYVLSNFNLKISNTLESSSPRYSKNKPKPEDIQKHFQQFLKPKNENLKPIPREFVTDSDILDKLGKEDFVTTSSVSLNNEVSLEDTSPLPEMQSLINDLSLALAPMPSASILTYDSLGAYEGVVSRNMLTPQSTNYTGSTNSTLVSPLFNSMIVGTPTLQPAVVTAFQPPSSEDIISAHRAVEKLADDMRSVVRPKRGRKPSKKK
jgi:hypothetical protein